MQELLVAHILKDSAHSAYAEAIREMPTIVWSCLLHPVKHYNSCSYNQLWQLSQLNPFALRMMLQQKHSKEYAATSIPVSFSYDIIVQG